MMARTLWDHLIGDWLKYYTTLAYVFGKPDRFFKCVLGSHGKLVCDRLGTLPPDRFFVRTLVCCGFIIAAVKRSMFIYSPDLDQPLLHNEFLQDTLSIGASLIWMFVLAIFVSLCIDGDLPDDRISFDNIMRALAYAGATSLLGAPFWAWIIGSRLSELSDQPDPFGDMGVALVFFAMFIYSEVLLRYVLLPAGLSASCNISGKRASQAVLRLTVYSMFVGSLVIFLVRHALS